MVQILSFVCHYNHQLHIVLILYPLYFINTSEQLIMSWCDHFPCPCTRSLTCKPSILFGILNYQVCAVCGNSPTDYPPLLLLWSNDSNVINIVPKLFYQVFLLSEIYTHWRIGKYLGYPKKPRRMLNHWKGLSKSQASPGINFSAYPMFYVVKYGEGLIPIINLFHLSHCDDEFDE